jgi:hypothetical protein
LGNLTGLSVKQLELDSLPLMFERRFGEAASDPNFKTEIRYR